jgi:hypothetical protein
VSPSSRRSLGTIVTFGTDNRAREKYGVDVSTFLLFLVSHPDHFFQLWNKVKAKEFSDEEYVWGPDPDLTPVGEGQAQSAKDAWMRERHEGIPLPEAMYCSPFRRAIRTCLITFGGWLLQDVHGSANGARPIIVEVVPPPPQASWVPL